MAFNRENLNILTSPTKKGIVPAEFLYWNENNDTVTGASYFVDWRVAVGDLIKVQSQDFQTVRFYVVSAYSAGAATVVAADLGVDDINVGNVTVTDTLTAGTITDGTAVITGGAITGVSTLGVGSINSTGLISTTIAGDNKLLISGDSASTGVANHDIGLQLKNADNTADNRVAIIPVDSAGTATGSIEWVITNHTNHYSDLHMYVRNAGGYVDALTLDANTGSTGGASSAGAGNQYVELTINGNRYKLLHDGTI